MKLIRWLLPIASLAFVLLFTLWDLRRSSTGPGPLHPAHAGLSALAGGTSCESCHQSGAGINAQGCTTCHAAIATQAQAHSGLHGSLTADQFARCEHCHSEHHGDTAPLIAAHAFARVGVPDEAAYDHRHVAFHLTGAHSQLLCVRCHSQADSLDPAVHARFLDQSQECSSCHSDTHQGAFGKDCESCHGQVEPFAKAPKFPHETFALRGAHAQVACATCHAAGSPHDVAALRQQALPARTCAACHADPHAAGATGVAALQLADTADCARCHAATHWAEARPTTEAHAAFGFALRGAHANVDCTTCHGDASHQPRWTGETPELAACATCHENPHRAELTTAATAAQGPAAGCAECHVDTDEHFAAGRMSAALHAATGFALATPHADVACAACHKGTERSERYPGRAAADCRACHQDVHRGQFAAEAGFAQCTACHTTSHFLPHEFGITAHAKTHFPLTGAHDAVSCAACHDKGQDGVRTFHGTATDCAACHADVHQGGFDRAGRPKLVDGRQGCARCHNTTEFAPVAAGFDHALWTGYQLAGAHAKAACTKCHPAGTASPGGNTNPHLGKAAGTTCAACHQDPHAGQFATFGNTDCARCHDGTAWGDLHFDHQKHSRFALDGLHEKLACAKCHVSYPTAAGPLVRYKPLGTACGDCHRLGASGEVLK